MKKLMILLPVLFAGLQPEQEEKTDQIGQNSQSNVSVVFRAAKQDKKQDGKIAFKKLDGNLYIIDEDGKNEKKFIDKGSGEITDFIWSGDGKKVVYNILKESRESEVHIINIDGKDHKKIVEDRNIVGRYFAASADGKKLVFRAVESGKDNIYIMDAYTLEKKILDESKMYSSYISLDLSRDGKQIVFFSLVQTGSKIDAGMYTMDVESKKKKKIMVWEGKLHFRPLKTIFSPDGNRILYEIEQDQAAVDSYIMDADGKNKEKLTRHISERKFIFGTGIFNWLPDGKWIVFTSTNEKVADICIIEANGKNEKNLTSDMRKGGDSSNVPPDGISDSPSVSPDGSKIVFVHRPKYFTPEIYIMNTDGSNKKKISEGTDPKWQPVAR